MQRFTQELGSVCSRLARRQRCKTSLPEKTKPLSAAQTGALDLNLDDDLLSHGEAPHYHRRCIVSLLSSGWDQVVPMLYGRQEILCADPSAGRISKFVSLYLKTKPLPARADRGFAK